MLAYLRSFSEVPVCLAAYPGGVLREHSLMVLSVPSSGSILHHKSLRNMYATIMAYICVHILVILVAPQVARQYDSAFRMQIRPLDNYA